MRFAVLSAVMAAIAPRAVAGEESVNLDYSFVSDPTEARGNTLSLPNDTVGLAARDMSMLEISLLLDKRQRCASGYGYCSSFGRCCPDTGPGPCCSYGYCLDSGQACCPNGPCRSGTTCCGRNHCRPRDAVCCGDESWCERGNVCVRISGYTYDVCCTNTRCTAYVTGGSTVTRTTTTSIRRTTTADDDRPTSASGGSGSGSSGGSGTIETSYYFTITWTYWVYYWWYVVEIRASVVTSSETTTSSSVRVRATDSAAASASFTAMSATIPTTTPSYATSLSSLAGSTSYDFGYGPNGTSTTTTRTTPDIFGGGGGGAGGVVGGGGASGAVRSVAFNTWAVMGLWAGIGGVVGVLMVAL